MGKAKPEPDNPALSNTNDTTTEDVGTNNSSGNNKDDIHARQLKQLRTIIFHLKESRSTTENLLINLRSELDVLRKQQQESSTTSGGSAEQEEKIESLKLQLIDAKNEIVLLQSENKELRLNVKQAQEHAHQAAANAAALAVNDSGTNNKGRSISTATTPEQIFDDIKNRHIPQDVRMEIRRMKKKINKAVRQCERLKKRKQNLEHELRTSRFREDEAVVFLRRIRSFYYLIWRNNVVRGSGGYVANRIPVVLTASKPPGAADTKLMIELDTLMLEAGLLEKDEVGKDTQDNKRPYRPSRSAFQRSNVAAEVAKRNAENAAIITSDNKKGMKPQQPQRIGAGAGTVEVPPDQPAQGPLSAIKREESPKVTDARQKLHSTPAGRFVTMKEKFMEEQLANLNERLVELEGELSAERKKTKPPAEGDAAQLTEECKDLRQQLEDKENDMRMFVTKLRESSIINWKMADSSRKTEEHILYLENRLENYRDVNIQDSKLREGEPPPVLSAVPIDSKPKIKSMSPSSKGAATTKASNKNKNKKKQKSSSDKHPNDEAAADEAAAAAESEAATTTAVAAATDGSANNANAREEATSKVANNNNNNNDDDDDKEGGQPKDDKDEVEDGFVTDSSRQSKKSIISHVTFSDHVAFDQGNADKLAGMAKEIASMHSSRSSSDDETESDGESEDSDSDDSDSDSDDSDSDSDSESDDSFVPEYILKHRQIMAEKRRTERGEDSDDSDDDDNSSDGDSSANPPPKQHVWFKMRGVQPSPQEEWVRRKQAAKKKKGRNFKRPAKRNENNAGEEGGGKPAWMQKLKSKKKGKKRPQGRLPNQSGESDDSDEPPWEKYRKNRKKKDKKPEDVDSDVPELFRKAKKIGKRMANETVVTVDGSSSQQADFAARYRAAKEASKQGVVKVTSDIYDRTPTPSVASVPRSEAPAPPPRPAPTPAPPPPGAGGDSGEGWVRKPISDTPAPPPPAPAPPPPAPAPPPPAPAPPPPAPAPPPPAPAPPPPAPAPPPPAPAPPPPPPKKSSFMDSDSESDSSSAPKKAPAPAKKSSFLDSDDSSTSDSSPAPKKAAPAAKKSSFFDDSDSDDSS